MKHAMTPTFQSQARPRSFLRGAALSLLLATGALAQDALPGSGTRAPADIALPVGHSYLVSAPWNVELVSVGDPEVANVQVVAPDKILLVGKKIGSTDIILWSENEAASYQARVIIGQDLDSIRRDLSIFLPGSSLELQQNRGVITIAGVLRRAEHAEALHRYLAATGTQYVDLTTVEGLQQVMIQVRVGEASRQAIRSLGINALKGGDDFFGGTTFGANQNGIDVGVTEGTPIGDNLPFGFNSDTKVGSGVTLFGGFLNSDLQVFVDALTANRYLRILAEPTLVALSGEEASFLAGGEFPVPIVQGSTAGAGTSITVEYKEFGVRLRFRPTVLGDGTIRMFVAPEVSDLSDVGAVNVEGFAIPSLLTRRSETTLEMKSGQTFAMAGLIDRSVSARVERVPGLGRLPVLGPLFRSIRYENGETELVVLVTANLVQPMNNAGPLPVPGVADVAPNDWELFVRGLIEGDAARLPASRLSWLREQRLDRLRGPGAWATYDERR
jgi:pilus assembly protein CpaC